MNSTLLLILLIFGCEFILVFIFALISNTYYRKFNFELKAIVKGTMERLFLYWALVSGYPHALTLFSGIKVATRLKHKEQPEEKPIEKKKTSSVEDEIILTSEDKFNDFYLIGNLISVAIAIFYVWLYNNIDS